MTQNENNNQEPSRQEAKITVQNVTDSIHEMLKMKAKNSEGELVLEFDASTESLEIFTRHGTNTTTENTETGCIYDEIFRISEYETLYDLLESCQIDPDDDDTRTKAELLTEFCEFFDTDLIDEAYDKVKESREAWLENMPTEEVKPLYYILDNKAHMPNTCMGSNKYRKIALMKSHNGKRSYNIVNTKNYEIIKLWDRRYAGKTADSAADRAACEALSELAKLEKKHGDKATYDDRIL